MILSALWVVVGCSGEQVGGLSIVAPSPALDTVGSDTALVVPRAALTVSLAPGLVAGEVSTYTVTGAAAGEKVTLMGSPAGLGDGPCLAALGGKCLRILAPVKKLGNATADGNGIASIPVTAPAAVGATLATQAVIRRGAGGALSVFSPERIDEVFPPWVSGLAARPANPTCVAPSDPPVDDASADVADAFPNLVFDRPNTMTQPPGDPDTWWIVEQPGRIFRFDDDDAVVVADLVLDIRGLVDDAGNEQGLLGFVFHPDFAVNGQAFVSYTTQRGADDFNELARYTSTDGGLTLDPTTAEVLFTLEDPFDNHNGGNILFGQDGFLHYGMGDGGGGDDPFDAAQDPFSHFGKMMRFDVDGAVPYAIPSDNPFADGLDGLPEIYAIGMRNPWRWSFDLVTGDMWVGDVGQGAREEIHVVERGGNYGWDFMEGFLCHEGPPCETIPGLTDPVLDYSMPGAAAAVGGYVYRGQAIPGLVGTYLFTDHFSNDLWGIRYVSGVPDRFTVVGGLGFDTTSFAEDAEGELYMLGIDGTIHRIVTTGNPPPIDDFPVLLSQTGCVDPLDATAPVDAMIPFAPNSPQWADGAAAQRWLAIPDGQLIDVGPEGDLDLPIGSVVAMELSVAGERIETRLLVRHDDGAWAGYSYVWDGDDAELALGSSAVATDLGPWRIPSRAECLSCHTDVAGRTLSLEVRQLNGAVTYPSTGITANQLFTLESAGFLTDPLGNTPDQLESLADPATAPVDLGARAYLHANCASCHQPGGPAGLADLDLRVTTVDPGGCALPPAEGNLGVAGAVVIDPGGAATSVLSLRMHATDAHRMPPVGSVIADPLGTSVVDAWIGGLAGCP